MPLDLQRIEAICFDVDGTLSDTDDRFVQRLVRYLSPIRHIFPHRDIHKLARRLVMKTEGPGNWAYSTADRMGLDSKFVAVGDLLYRLGIGRSAQPFLIIPGVYEMLERLYKRYPLGIVSARGYKSTYQFLDQFSLRAFFKCVASGQTCTHTKPYPDPIEWAAVQMSVTTRACLMVGDTVVDIRCGKKSGAQTVGVLCGFGERNELEKAGADQILDNTPQLIDILVN